MDEHEYLQEQQAAQDRSIAQQQAPMIPQIVEQMQQNQAILVAQTDPKKIIKEIILRLEGREERSDGSIVKVGVSLLNEKGIKNIKFILDSNINDNIRLSHLEKRDITQIMDVIQNDLVDDLTLNYKDYEIKNKTDLDSINNSILVNVFCILKRAEEQGEKNWLGRSVLESIQSATRVAPQKKGGIFDKLKL